MRAAEKMHTHVQLSEFDSTNDDQYHRWTTPPPRPPLLNFPKNVSFGSSILTGEGRGGVTGFDRRSAAPPRQSRSGSYPKNVHIENIFDILASERSSGSPTQPAMALQSFLISNLSFIYSDGLA